MSYPQTYVPTPLELPFDDWLDPEIICWAVIPAVIAMGIVALRFYTRHYITGKIEIEDWFALGALIMSLAVSVGIVRQSYFALGKHLSTIGFETLSNFLRALWYTAFFYHLSLGLVKASILLLYIRMFKSYDTLRRAAWIMLAIILVGICGILAITMTACIPLRKKWDSNVEGYCHPNWPWWAATGFQAGSDVIIFLMPLSTIYKLRLPRRQKLGLCAVFALGLFVCLVAILRIVWVSRANDPDYTFNGKAVGEWSCIEINTAIVCASLMVLKPLYHKLRPCKTRLVSEDDVPGSYDPPPTVGAARIRPLLQNHGSGCVTPADAERRSANFHYNPDAHPDENASRRMHSLCGPTTRTMSPTLPAKPFFIESVREKTDKSVPIAQMGSPLSVRVW
ncbi:hypothetical protein PG993_010602 [Apiospora rasikravindrae]|uniref:Rhodopsin domain-containing protein n=1 Tax=Apiospora rasikravindrae TaxID=990691 RepID=A0ABR1SMR7_9PEZI